MSMYDLLLDSVFNFLNFISSPSPRDGLHVIPGTKPLTIEAAICPPLLYYIALLFLPPAPPSVVDTFAVGLLRNGLAAFAGFLFFRLPLAYHIPQSIGLTYQLGLVGLYGGCRVLDAFFISRYGFNHIPRRVSYEHTLRPESPFDTGDEKEWSDGGQSDPFSGKIQADERPEKCPIVSCEYHTKGFARNYDRNRHVLVHYKASMVCGFCPGSGSSEENCFNRADVFKRHLIKAHSVDKDPSNGKKKSIDNSNENLSSYCADATGKCSICSGTFNNAQDFYNHLDECIFQVVAQVHNDNEKPDSNPKHPEDSKQQILNNHTATTNPHPSTRRTSLLGPYFLVSRALAGPSPTPVYESAKSEDGWPHNFSDRASWALELELSMRGIGFTWTTADVRHTRKTWMPTVSNRVHSILVHVFPVLLISGTTIRHIYLTYLSNVPSLFTPSSPSGLEVFDTHIPLPQQLLLTASLGAFLMTAFSLAHSLFAIALSPLSPSPLSFFPPLYTTRVWDLTSVRKFWSFGWHRLFARLFLVWGVWPGEWIERKLLGKTKDQPADVGKVLGGFLSSAFVHSFSVRCVMGGDWSAASGEAKFFALNGLAVVFEGAVQRLVKRIRKSQGWNERPWYDRWIGRVWWITVLLWTGRNFARGWVKSSLVREMAFM